MNDTVQSVQSLRVLKDKIQKRSELYDQYISLKNSVSRYDKLIADFPSELPECSDYLCCFHLSEFDRENMPKSFGKGIAPQLAVLLSVAFFPIGLISLAFIRKNDSSHEYRNYYKNHRIERENAYKIDLAYMNKVKKLREIAQKDAAEAIKLYSAFNRAIMENTILPIEYCDLKTIDSIIGNLIGGNVLSLSEATERLKKTSAPTQKSN